MPAPAATIAPDPASREQVVKLTPAAGREVAHWTVRVLAHDTWRTFILPGSQRQLVVAPDGESATRVVVTSLDRVGIESAVVTATAPGARKGAAKREARKKPARR